MVVRTAKSRSAANQNMAKVMIRNEQKKHLPYVLPLNPHDDIYAYDGDSEDSDNQDESLKFSTLLTHHLQKNQPPNKKAKQLKISTRMHFLGPHRLHTFILLQRRHLATFFNIIMSNNDFVVPISGIRWTGAVFQNSSTDSFKVISKDMERSNSTRSSSIVCFFKKSAGNVVVCFGQVLFFFQVTMGIDAKVYYLAYIEEFYIKPDGRLFYICEDAGRLFVEAGNIQELLGLFDWNDRQYLYSSKTSLLG